MAEAVVDQMHRAGVAWKLLRLATQNLAVEIEIGVVEGFGQIGRHVVQVMHRQEIAPYGNRRRGEQLGEPGERGVLAHDDMAVTLRAFRGKTFGGEERAPREARRIGREFGFRHRVVGFVRVSALDRGPMDLRDPGFQSEHRIAALLRILLAGQRQHRHEIFAIGIARLGEGGIVFQVIVAVRHAEAGLGDEHHILVRAFRVGVYEGAEEAVGRNGGIAHRARDIVRRFQRCEPGEVLLGRREAALFDLRGIHEGVIEIADFLLLIGELRIGLRFQPGHDVLHAFFAEDLQVLERSGGGAVRRDHRVLEPGAVGVVEEVVAGFYGFVHAGQIDAPGAEGGLCRRLGVGSGKQARQRQGADSERETLHFIFSQLKGRPVSRSLPR